MDSRIKSRVLFEGYGYTAAISGYTAVGGPYLTVTRKGAGGRALAGGQAEEWAAYIENALDSREAAALCRGVYRI